MRIYLSYGGGVDSTACYLEMTRRGFDFEAVYCDHGCDWPETYEYLEMFQGWLEENGYRKITVIKPPIVQGVSNNLYEYSWHYHMVPIRERRWCTDKFKVRPLHRYFKKPCFVCIAFDAGEAQVPPSSP